MMALLTSGICTNQERITAPGASTFSPLSLATCMDNESFPTGILGSSCIHACDNALTAWYSAAFPHGVLADRIQFPERERYSNPLCFANAVLKTASVSANFTIVSGDMIL